MRSLLLIFIALFLTITLSAQEENDKCFRCHQMSTLGYKDDSNGLLKNLAVNKEEFNHSQHGHFYCTDCHSEDFNSFPHADELKDEDLTCLMCHADSKNGDLPQFESIQKAYEESVHHELLGDNFSCFSCHDPHTFSLVARVSDDIKQTVHHANQICMDCHNDQSKIDTYTDRVFSGLKQTHEWLPHQDLHWKNVRCIDCHTDPEQPGVSHLITSKDKAVKNCVECHSTDTRLAQTLYKFQKTKEREKTGFFNSIILNNSYIVGATRNYYLNVLSFVIFGAVLLALFVHGFNYLRAYKKKEKSVATAKEYFYPLYLRVWHWANALFFVILILSGITLQYASISDSLMSFDTAIQMHNAAGMLLTLNYLLFFLGNLITGNYNQYIPKIKGLVARLIKQIRFYLFGIFKNEPHPFETDKKNKFNPLQQITYLGIMYAAIPLIIITGWALLYPEILLEDLFGESGLFLTAVLHTILGFSLSMFMIGHMYLAITGHTLTSNLKAMVSGWHEVHEEHKHEGKNEEKE